MSEGDFDVEHVFDRLVQQGAHGELAAPQKPRPRFTGTTLGHRQCCPLFESLIPCLAAVQFGQLEVMQGLRSQIPPSPWSDDTCAAAAEGGCLDVLKWLRNEDPPCPWSGSVCEAAAQAGHLEVLKWVRSQDPPCPWSQCTCAQAAGAGHLGVLKWLKGQDPPCSWVYACDTAAGVEMA